MTRIITIHNVSGSDKMYVGQSIADTTTYTLSANNVPEFKIDSTLFADVSLGDVLIGDGTNDFTDPTEGWAWLQGDIAKVEITQLSPLGKVEVHSSYKPNALADNTLYAVWTGCGDDMSDGSVATGPLLNFHMTIGGGNETVEMEFHPDNGRIWLHEGYIQFTNAGFGDYLTATIRSRGTVLQQSANLDLELSNGGNGNFVIPASGGPGTGTHGFADANIALIPQTFTHDGEWNWNPIDSLQPNLAGDGEYRISIVDKTVHKFINRIPLYGTTAYTIFSSDETTELPPNFYVRVRVYNVSDTDWHLSAFIECYRERTTKLQ